MRIPWIATIDALTDELSQYLDMPQQETSAIRSTEARGVLDRTEEKKPLNQPQTQIKLAIEHLSEARQQLEDIRSFKVRSYQSPPEREADFSDFDYMDLDCLDARQVRYPDQEGREALARFIEKGGLFGPILGQHIAEAFRGNAKFKPGLQSTFEEGRWRRFVVKRIATIQHLYDVGRATAVEMFCAAEHVDDEAGAAFDRFIQWVKRDQRQARIEIEKSNLSKRDEKHFLSTIHGLHADLPRGHLKGHEYPDALEELRSQIEA